MPLGRVNVTRFENQLRACLFALGLSLSLLIAVVRTQLYSVHLVERRRGRQAGREFAQASDYLLYFWRAHALIAKPGGARSPGAGGKLAWRHLELASGAIGATFATGRDPRAAVSPVSKARTREIGLSQRARQN